MTVPEPVLALQLAVRVERTDPPTVERVCATTAAATVAMLDDPRSQPGGPWHDAVTAWADARIRKIVRRARSGAWERAHDVPGVTVAVDGVEVRAFVPGPVDRIPPEVARLQIRSTPLGYPRLVGEPDSTPGLHIAVSPLVAMSWGKQAAQCAHAAQRAWATGSPYVLAAWEALGRPITVVHPNASLWSSLEQRATTRIHDGGFTEIPAGTLTTLAWWTAPHPLEARPCTTG